MLTDKIKWGVIGSGGIARRRTIPEGIAAADNAHLVAVFNPSPGPNLAVAQQFGARAASTVEELLATDIDAVYIASPPNVHRAQVVACAQAGKHVLCEKPLATSVGDAEAMVAACAAAQVRFGTGLMMRFQAQHQAARQLVVAGRIGRPVFARTQLSCWHPPAPGAWRQEPASGGGGALMDLGGHCIDLLETMMGPVTAVSCTTTRAVHDYPVEDGAVTTLQFKDGALAVVDTFFCIRDETSRNALEIYGTQGSIHGRGTLGQGLRGEMVACLLATAGSYEPRQVRPAATEVPIAPPTVNVYRAEIEEFGRAIHEQRDPINSGAVGLRSQRILAACYESARTGRQLILPPGW